MLGPALRHCSGNGHGRRHSGETWKGEWRRWVKREEKGGRKEPSDHLVFLNWVSDSSSGHPCSRGRGGEEEEKN